MSWHAGGNGPGSEPLSYVSADGVTSPVAAEGTCRGSSGRVPFSGCPVERRRGTEVSQSVSRSDSQPVGRLYAARTSTCSLNCRAHQVACNCRLVPRSTPVTSTSSRPRSRAFHPSRTRHAKPYTLLAYWTMQGGHGSARECSAARRNQTISANPAIRRPAYPAGTHRTARVIQGALTHVTLSTIVVACCD